ncbi:MAG: helix-turn-helix transcriptional regulator [Streptococcaceae bacterium]|nr:helix-turn-helix transcriptional regulator [Streptococcaceae bacterium]MCH4177870.1 helix-turn-helix transcriptional regulator [Streptococcaceae bacterium]
MVDKNKYQLCPKYEQAFQIVGKKWTGLIVDVLYNNGLCRFKTLNQQIENISERVLTVRLKELEAEGIVSKCEREEIPGYELTEKGILLAKALNELKNWSDQFC